MQTEELIRHIGGHHPAWHPDVREIRRGAPIAPISTAALAALAAAALGATALRLFQVEDANIMALVWQFGSVALLAALARLFGRLNLRWTRREEALARGPRLPL